MILPDKLEHVYRRILNQKNNPSCSTHAFLGVMAELVENKTGVPTDFDYNAIYKKMNMDDKEGINIDLLANYAVNHGFKTIDGRLVKATKVIKTGKYQNWESQSNKVCVNIHKYGPAILTLNYNSKTSLIKKDKNNVLTNVFKFWRSLGGKDDKSHAIALTGFDRINHLFIETNSWGDRNSYRKIKFEDLYKIYGDAHFITDIIVTKK